MGAVPAEPIRSALDLLARTEPADGYPWRHFEPLDCGGEDAVYIVGSVGDRVPYTRVTDYSQTRGRLKRMLDDAVRAQRSVVALDGLDEAEDADHPLTLHFASHGRPESASGVDVMWGDIVSQCKSPQDRQAVSTAVLIEHEASVSSDSSADAEIGSRWRALPLYGDQLLIPRTCCGTSTLTPEAVAAAVNHGLSAPPVPVMESDDVLRLSMYLHFALPQRFAPLTVTATIRDKRFVQEYREGWRRFLGGVLSLLRLMVVRLLTALSHLAWTPSFVLVMLATARRYGRRGDGDSHPMSAPTWHLIRPWGAARLAT
jgi:hypothetical protein